jgi:hypothetical protein
METAVNFRIPPNPGFEWGFFIPKHLFRPLFPRNPFFPASGPAHRLFEEPPAKSKFLGNRDPLNQ